MEITLFGAIWIAVLLCAGITSQKALAKCVIISALFQAGAVMIIGETVITPLTSSCLIYIVFSLGRHNVKVRIPQFLMAFFIMWLIFLCSSIISSVLFRGTVIRRISGFFERLTEIYQGHISLYGLAELLLYGITAVLIFNDKPFNEKDIDKLIDSGFWFVLIVGAWQFTTKVGIIPRIHIVEEFIYSNSISNSIEYHAPVFSLNYTQVRFYSSFMEPSYLSAFLGAIFYHYISKFIKEGRSTGNGLKALATAFMAVISYSTTAYAIFAVACLIIIIQLNSVKRIVRAWGIGVFAIGLLLIVISSLGIWERILLNSIEKLSTSSAMIRGTWNDACIQALKDTMGVGVGYGNLFGSSLMLTLLGSVGILGTLSYLFFIINVLNPRIMSASKYNNAKEDYIFRFRIMLILCIAAQMIAVGRLNYSVFWMMLFILMAAYAAAGSRTGRKNIYEKTVHHDFYERKSVGEI